MTEPELSADNDPNFDGTGQTPGTPLDDDPLEVAIDAITAADEDDLDGDGEPDPPDPEEV